MRPRTHYEILGILPDATALEIKHAYRKKAEKYHPDRVRERPERTRKRYEKRMKLVNIAKDVLVNPTSRSYYDYKLGYCESVEVQEEDIEEVEPLDAEQGIERRNGSAPSPEKVTVPDEGGGKGVDQRDFGETEYDGYGDDDRYKDRFYADEKYLAAQVEEYVEVGGGTDGSAYQRVDDDEPVFEVTEADVIDTVPDESSGPSGNMPVEDVTDVHDDDDEASFGQERNAAEERIPFWNNKDRIEEPEPTFQRVDLDGGDLKRMNRERDTLFIKGKGYHIQVNPVSMYRDDRVVIEVTASGMKMDELARRRKNSKKMAD